MAAEKQFEKYGKMGAYHWDALSRNILKHHLFTATRYQLSLKLAQISPSSSVVDVGSGDGALMFLIRQKFPSARVVGVEPSADGRSVAVEMWRRKGIGFEVHEDSSSLLANSYDVVFCAEVIEHVQQPLLLLQELHRILKPGGRCVISTPVRLTETPWDAEHVREFFPQEFSSLVSQMFEVTEHSFCSSVAAVGAYQWRPWLTRHRPVLAYAMNALSLWCGANPFLFFNPLNKFWMTQIISAIKR